MSLTFGSLFAGIGGIDLGLERAGMKCRWQVEIDEYCRRVLAKHWPDVPKYTDIRQVGDELERVDLIAGGFPCQDISDAGKRIGITGERSGLWTEMHRIICCVRPRYLFVENVPALLRRGLGAVLGDLAACGYVGFWDCIPAGAFGAHFLGDRIYVVAESATPGGVRWKRRWPSGQPKVTNQWGCLEFTGLLRHVLRDCVPAGRLGRVSDGVPNRVDKLRGLGNAVVPQVAEWIGRQIIDHHCGSDEKGGGNI